MIKIDKRKNYYMVLDTETTGGIMETKSGKEFMQKFIYDIGYTIADKKDTVYIKRNFIIKEIYLDIEKMSTMYFINKKPMYDDAIATGAIEILPLKDIIKIMQKDIQDYNICGLCAYNVGFDIDALQQTIQAIYPQYQTIFKQTKSGKYAPDNIAFFNKYIAKKDIEIIDIWTLACKTLCNQKTFQAYYKQTTPKGNIKTNAEIVYNYINDTQDFEEDHTALSDAIIETEILQRIYRIHQNVGAKFEYFPTRFVKLAE